MKLVYFAWVRERVGKAEEEVVPPAVGDDRRRADGAGSAARGEEYAHAFENPKVDPRRHRPAAMCSPTRAIAGAREIAFFPPMTGG